jgi:hypothetical protein
MAEITLDPSLLSMRILLQTDQTIFLRLPKALQRDTNGCSCKHCKLDPSLARWDTLAIPLQSARKSKEWSYTVHMPDASVPETIAYFKAKRLKPTDGSTTAEETV